MCVCVCVCVFAFVCLVLLQECVKWQVLVPSSLKFVFKRGGEVLVHLILSSAATLNDQFCESNFLTAICHCFL